MTQHINYIALMQAGGGVGVYPSRFSVHRDGDIPTLLNDGQSSSLFVLQGALNCVFKGTYMIQLVAQQMMVVDKAQLRELQCVGDTVFLECVESEKMSPFMQTIFRAFNKPCSEIISLNAKIKTWCHDLFVDLLDNPIRNNDYYHARCSKLTSLLLEYPLNVLGTLYVPLYACSNCCETCTRLFLRNENKIE